jgi:hypothetical protein
MSACAIEPSFDLRIVPAVMDIEASGFGKGSYPIEVGYVLPGGRSDCMLIRPTTQWLHWDPAAEQLHLITRDQLLRHGLPVAAVVERLDAALAGRTVYTDGWGNDYSWLSTLYEAAGARPSFQLDNLQKLLTQDELRRWDATKAQVFEEAALARHRASADARLLQSTVMRLHAGLR